MALKGSSPRQGSSGKAAGRRGAPGGNKPPPRPKIDIPIYEDPKKPGKGVPPADAFDSVKRLPPPDLPGYEQERAAYYANQADQTRQPPSRPSSHPPPARRPKAKKPAQAVANPVKRRRNRRIAAILIVLILVGIGVWFSLAVWFKIQNFAVEGESPYTLEEIMAVFGHEPGEHMFGFNAKSEARAIEQALPYIEHLAIRRKLPDTVVFRVEPATETYWLEQGSQVAVLSESRKVLRLSEVELPELVRIYGLEDVMLQPGLPLAPLAGESAQAPSQPAAQAPSSEAQAQSTSEPGPDQALDGALESLDILLAAIEQAGLERVCWVNVADPLDLQIGWDYRIVVKLGAKGNLDRKLQFARVLLTEPDKSEITAGDSGTLDVSGYPAVDRAWFTPAG